MKPQNNLDRRNFLRKGALAAAAFTVVPRRVLGGADYVAPSDEITKALIGCGAMGQEHLPFYTSPDRDRTGARVGRLVALCDVDRQRLQSTLGKVKEGVKAYHDFRELLQQPGVDVVHIATPPHWHGVMAKMAAEAGKDIWCEKPMTRTIGEGKRLVEAVQRTGRMFRANTWFRFRADFYGLGTTVKPLKKLIDSGALGWPLKITVGGVTGYNWKFFWKGEHNLKGMPVPDHLDYDFWLGPAPYKPYNPNRVHSKFRGYWDYDGGGLADMGQHYLDPVQYMLGKDDTSPVRIDIDAPQQHYDAVGTWRRIEFTYADGCKIILDGANKDKDAAYIEGPAGKVYKNFESTIPEVAKLVESLPDPEPRITSFHESVRTRKKFALNEQNGHRSATIVNLGVIAHRLGRSLDFDPVKQKFINDDGANGLIDQPMRGPWQI